ncbi:Ycf66 family protein [Cyanobacterium stanieri LEGE 03274]|uniref:Ycf66 family protein n=1 Tax=Cyanobacterium stanieri LEGE 03274 TaxID=1828756 RepID=A0ABR9V3D7_9CHRO|nr:Ycf66 family protein [Cyanobacterium stanieri]MBE9221646.1 Ycf66 family protein [Cyanobacterium stanieri LEGE 03274]
MVNFGLNSASILGIFLAVAGGGLYLMRSLRPEISRDHDIFFAAVGLLCGGILLWHGWRLDPILQFSQLLLAGSAIFFAIETIRLRGATNDQAKRSSSYVEDDRPVSRVYRAELDQYDSYEEEEEQREIIPRRRLEGSPDRTSSRRSSYVEDPPRSRRTRRTTEGYGDDISRPRRPSSPSSRGYESDWDETPDHWDDNPPRRSPRTSRGDRPSSPPPESSRRPSRRPPVRRPRSPEDMVSSMGSEYVDYQPIDGNNDYDNQPDNEPPTPRNDRPSNAPDFDY